MEQVTIVHPEGKATKRMGVYPVQHAPSFRYVVEGLDPRKFMPRKRCLALSALVAALMSALILLVLFLPYAAADEQVLLQGGVATLSGTARAVARAQELLQRKAAALEFVASRSRPAAARPPPPLPPTEAAPDYNFSGLVQPAPPSGGLNLLGAYNSDSDGS